MSIGVQAAGASGSAFAPGGPFAHLDLTASQKTQLRSIVQNGRAQGLSLNDLRSQVAGVLTPEQQALFKTDVQNARSSGSGLQHLRGAGGDSTGYLPELSASTGIGAIGNGLSVADVQNQNAAAAFISDLQTRTQIEDASLPE